MGHFGGMHFLWWIIGIVLILIIFRKPFFGQFQKKQNPLEILKERLAKGEISKEEFEERKKILENK